MQIVDYASLQSAVADWLNRADLTARIPDFIGLGEIWMMRKLRLRLMELEIPFTGAPGSRTLALPSDYREPLNLWWNNGVDRQPLRFVPAALLDVWSVPTQPQYWTIDGATIAFNCPCNQAYSFTFRYRQGLALSDANPTNILLTTYPDIYLAAAMVEAAPYLKDADAQQMWQAKRGSISHDIREEEERANGLSTLSTEPSLLTRGHQRGGYNVLRDY